jgi:hypothetical protein
MRLKLPESMGYLLLEQQEMITTTSPFFPPVLGGTVAVGLR